MTIPLLGVWAVSSLWGGETDFGLTPFYAESGWPTIHRDSRNSDFAPFVAPAANRVAWTALDGTAVISTAVRGPGPQGNVYVTAGGGPGTSHLHAFDPDGNPLWQAAPQLSPDDLDSGAVFSPPLVDRDGDLYVADRNQLWAFHADGSVKWTSPLAGDDDPVTALILTQQGLIGGVSFGGKVVLFRRDDGSLAAPILDLPGGSGPAGSPIPAGLWSGLLDPNVIEDVYHGILGQVFEVTNAPAVHPETGRIYIAGAGATPDTGSLYGIDLVQGQLQIAFTAPMGGGSGTSPTISGDGERVYVVDGDGVMIAFDAEAGTEVWATGSARPTTSPAVGPDETIYTGGSKLTALDPTDGSVQWSRNYNALAAALLPTVSPAPPVFLSGAPIAQTNGVLSLSAQKIWAVLVLGYGAVEPASGALTIQPRLSLLASISPADGSLLGLTALRDTSEGVISIAEDGSLYVTHASISSSISYYGINPLLPPALRLPGPPPGGFSAIEPLSFLDLAQEAVKWCRELNGEALSSLAGAELSAASTAVGRGKSQASAAGELVEEAVARGELEASAGEEADGRLAAAVQRLTRAGAILDLAEPTPVQLWVAARDVLRADAALAEALSALSP